MEYEGLHSCTFILLPDDQYNTGLMCNNRNVIFTIMGDYLEEFKKSLYDLRCSSQFIHYIISLREVSENVFSRDLSVGSFFSYVETEGAENIINEVTSSVGDKSLIEEDFVSMYYIYF